MSDSAKPNNPYEAPTAQLSDPTISGASGELIENGRKVPAANGPRWIRRGWELFRVAPVNWIGIWLLYVVIVGGVSLIPIVGGLLGVLAHPLFLGGLMVACRAADKGEAVRVSALFSPFSTHLGPLVLLGLLQFAAYLAVVLVLVILGALMFGGAAAMGMLQEGSVGAEMLLPLIGLGIVGFALGLVIAMANWFSPALIVLHGIGPLQALRMSLLACLKNILPFLLYFLVCLGLTILAILPLLLGLLVLAPVLFCSIYAAYRELFVAQG